MRRKIVIVGGGFAGVVLARRLERKLRADAAEITLVDASPYHTLRPKLPQAVGGRIPCAVHVPFAELFAKTRVRLVQRKVREVDPDTMRVLFEAGSEGEASPELDADFIVVATGGESVPPIEVEPGGTLLTAWSFNQACDIRRRVAFVSKAFLDGKPVDAGVVVIGGGFIGAEMAAEIQERLVRLGAARKGARVTLVEREDRILPRLGEPAARLASKRLRELGVDILTGTEAHKVTKSGVACSGGRTVHAGTVVWAGGVATSPILTRGDLLTAEGRILVDERLRVPSAPGLYAVGDCAAVAGAGAAPNEPSAHRAVDHARVAADNLAAELGQGPFKAVRTGSNVYLLGLGTGYGLLSTSKSRSAWAGRVPGLLKEAVMLRHLHNVGGTKVALRALRPVIAASLTRRAWDTDPLPEGNVLC